MGVIASQITSLTIDYSTVYSDADQRKHQSPASLAFVGGTHRGPVNSPHKWPVTRKMFPFDDVIMKRAQVFGRHKVNYAWIIIFHNDIMYYVHNYITNILAFWFSINTIDDGISHRISVYLAPISQTLVMTYALWG